jgi:hypothetical protein
MEPTLETLLNGSAPPVGARTTELEGELRVLVAASEAAAAPGRPRRARLLAGAGIALGAVVLGSGASAAGLVPAPRWAPWFAAPDAVHSQHVSTGESCEVRYGVKSIEDPSHPATSAERAAAVAAGKSFLRGFDFASVDVDRAVEQVPATALAGDESRAELETFAVQLVVQERLDAELARRGLPATVGVSTATRCGDGAR